MECEMLDTQKLYCDYLEDIAELTRSVGITNERLDSLRGAVVGAELLVPVIGAFSAGKSTLINSFLEKNCLPVDITPETALATELHYSVSERLEAVRANGSTDRYQLSGFSDLKEKASEYRFVRAYINSDQLKTIQPLVLVDMPGFDSPVGQHSQAIIEYIGRGTHYVVLTSVEEGNLTRSMLRQISDVYDVNKGISFFLSKSNLRGAVEVGEIVEKISSQLEDYFNESHTIVSVGADGGKDLARIIERIDPEALMTKLFKNLVS
jgi:GTPase SAR1 family protein